MVVTCLRWVCSAYKADVLAKMERIQGPRDLRRSKHFGPIMSRSVSKPSVEVI